MIARLLGDKIAEVTPSQMADYSEAFELFDKDGDGTISTEELKNLLRCFEQEATREEVIEIIKIYDKDNTGSIFFDSFV